MLGRDFGLAGGAELCWVVILVCCAFAVLVLFRSVGRLSDFLVCG